MKKPVDVSKDIDGLLFQSHGVIPGMGLALTLTNTFSFLFGCS